MARLLLVMRICGQGNTGLVRGRTKLAKLDFFVRYPKFLELALSKMNRDGTSSVAYVAGADAVEASMVRYRYGPWDHRYFNLLAAMSARGLIRIGGGTKSVTYSLTPTGSNIADGFQEIAEFASVAERCRIVADSLAQFTGTQLKEFIYDAFAQEVATLPIGSVIKTPDLTSRGEI